MFAAVTPAYCDGGTTPRVVPPVALQEAGHDNQDVGLSLDRMYHGVEVDSSPLPMARFADVEEVLPTSWSTHIKDAVSRRNAK